MKDYPDIVFIELSKTDHEGPEPGSFFDLLQKTWYKECRMKRQQTDQPYVTVNSAVCHGKPIIAGTRVMVWQILELLESGEARDAVYQAFPSLPRGGIEAALGYAAEKAKSERYIPFLYHDNHPAISA